MYNLLRQIHLFTAFVLTAFVLMYFISGFVMIFENTFERKDISVERNVRHILGVYTLSNDTLLAVLQTNFSVSGQYEIRKNETRTVVNYRHPGQEINAVIAPSDTVTVTTKTKNFIGTLHQLHRQHGYRGGWNYYLWAFFYDLSAISMIVFAFTGVYLWYKNERIKWPGLLILAAFTSFTVFTYFYLTYLN